MLPVKSLVAAAATAIGTDSSFLAQPTPFVQVALVQAPFTPSPTLILADLHLADFHTSTALAAASAATEVSQDPFTGDYLMQVRAPAGGWHWVTTDGTNLPQTIYGFALLDSAGAVLFGTELLLPPVPLVAQGQSIDLPSVKMRLPQGSLS